MKKKTTYTKKFILESAAKGDVTIFKELARQLIAGEELSLAEAEEAAQYVDVVGPEPPIENFDLENIAAAKPYIFVKLYVQYVHDLDGTGTIRKPDHTVPYDKNKPAYRSATEAEKKTEAARLNKFYLEWEPVYFKSNHPDSVLNHVINETKPQLEELDQLLTEGKISTNEHKYKRKATVLRGKLIFLRTKRLFEDFNEDQLTIKFDSTEIKIEPRAVVHILNGHYAARARHHQSEKSYHKDETNKFFEDPTILKAILEELGSNLYTKHSNPHNIYFKRFEQIYVVHSMQTTKNVAGIGLVSYWRLQSFYPLTDANKLAELKLKYTEIKLDDNLAGYAIKAAS